MQLRLKIIMILGTLLAMGCWASYEIQHRVVFPGFIALEREHALDILNRCTTAINDEADRLDVLCHDWAAWNETVKFVQGQVNDYVDVNMQPETFKNNSMDLLAVLDATGHQILGWLCNPELPEPFDLAELTGAAMSDTHPLLDYDSNLPLHEQCVRGLIKTSMGPMLVASRPILTSRNEGPKRGYYIMGRFLDSSLISAISEQIEIELQLWPVSDLAMPRQARNMMEKIKDDNAVLAHEEKEEKLHAYTMIPDIGNEPALLLKTTNDRNITLRGASITRIAALITAALGVLTLVVLIIALQILVLSPVARLTRHVISIGKSKDLTGHIAVRSRDEIGALSSEFNNTVRGLSDARNRLLEQSYYSGLVEMASGIMHNIRNALTPTVLRIEILRRRFESLPLEKVETALQELVSEGVSESRATELNLYLQRSIDSLKILFDNTNEEHMDILKSVMHIEEILSSHELFSQANRALDHLQVDNLVDDAVRFMKTKLRDSIRIDVDPNLSELPAIWAERIVLMQVLTNLFNNAAEAIISNARNNQLGHIRISGYVDIDDPRQRVHLEVSDNGEGMDPETLQQIFNRGFTTKEKRYTGGIGLHWCGNVMTAMNGSIHVESDGKGQGATFHLLLPQSSESNVSATETPLVEATRL